MWTSAGKDSIFSRNTAATGGAIGLEAGDLDRQASDGNQRLGDRLTNASEICSGGRDEDLGGE